MATMTNTSDGWRATPIPARQDGESLETWVERAWAAADEGDLFCAADLYLGEDQTPATFEELTALPVRERNQILAAIP